MGKIGNDKFYGKIYWDKTQEELHEIIHQKLRVLADCVAKHMIMDWRSLADSNVHDPNPTHVGEHDLITMIEFLERYDTVGRSIFIKVCAVHKRSKKYRWLDSDVSSLGR